MTHALVAVGVVAGALALGYLGRRAVAGELAGSLGDKSAQDTADALPLTQALAAGLRVLAGKPAAPRVATT